MAESYKCFRCRVTFEVRAPDCGEGSGWFRAETTRCAVPRCAQRFWHSGASHFHAHATVGIDPRDLPEDGVREAAR